MSTEHIPQCNQSEPLADASGMIVDLMNENAYGVTGDPATLKRWMVTGPEVTCSTTQ